MGKQVRCNLCDKFVDVNKIEICTLVGKEKEYLINACSKCQGHSKVRCDDN